MQASSSLLRAPVAHRPGPARPLGRSKALAAARGAGLVQARVLEAAEVRAAQSAVLPAAAAAC